MLFRSPASVVDQTTWQMRRVAEIVSPEGGVMLYAGAYKRGDGYRALSDDLNSVNIHVWRQLSWNPHDDVEMLWRDLSGSRHAICPILPAVILRACEARVALQASRILLLHHSYSTNQI